MPIKGKKIGKKFRKQGVLREIHTKIKISLCSHCINDYKGRWSGLRDLNPRSLGPKPSAIPNFAKPGYEVKNFSDVVKSYFRPEQGRSQEGKVPVPQWVFGLADIPNANRAPTLQPRAMPYFGKHRWGMGTGSILDDYAGEVKRENAGRRC